MTYFIGLIIPGEDNCELFDNCYLLIIIFKLSSERNNLKLAFPSECALKLLMIMKIKSVLSRVE